MDLNTIWFILVAVLLAGYAVLDGFDLGVGVLHLFARDEEERRAHRTSIGPVWDGNEVWLLTGGGALFAAFPAVYATVFSGFYLALMLLLFALILRAVALEWRSQMGEQGWRRGWDHAFGVASLVPSILFGVAVGNILRGLPIDADGNYLGTFLGLLNPYAILIGLVSLAMFVMHGALWLRVKTEGALADRMRKVALGTWIALIALYAVATAATIYVSPHLFDGVTGRAAFWVFLVLMLAAHVAVPVMVRRGQDLKAFLASCTAIVSMIGLAGVSLFPRLVPSSLGLDYSLTIYNASSSPKTLGTMLVIALIGMPLVIAYTAMIYRVFRGKVRLEVEGGF
jgi:cytochrome d ubiquinol oxidase subunit II